MKKPLKGALVYAQSGGPSAVINASASGVFEAALKSPDITAVYGALHGIQGIFNEDFIDIAQEDVQTIELLTSTPAAALGSVRYKIADWHDDERDYRRILEVFKKYNIRYFLYNGGNDSMDTCLKVGSYLDHVGYECRVIGIPKTVDNDLMLTDHCPGYGSTVKYLATSILELALDTGVYDLPVVTIVEVMGRNAGWIAAGTAVANQVRHGPDLIYLPEVPFDLEQFVKDIAAKLREQNNVMVVVSEGIKDVNGNYISEYQFAPKQDSFGHTQLGGLAANLVALVHERLGVKIRPIEFSLLQRCAAHLASLTDRTEAYQVGRAGVKFALQGLSQVMVGIKRENNDNYYVTYQPYPLEKIANFEKTFPLAWYDQEVRMVTDEFYEYIQPLVAGLPKFAQLKKVKVK